MKIKLNAKLTAFLVSLFISLIIIILGNKNKYCLSFGFVALAVSMVIFAKYNKERTQKMLDEIDNEIEELEESLENATEEEADDIIYSVKQLYIRSGKLLKRKKTGSLAFYLFAGFLVLFAIIGIF